MTLHVHCGMGPTQLVTDLWGLQMSSSLQLRTGKAELNKRNPSVAAKLTVPLYK